MTEDEFRAFMPKVVSVIGRDVPPEAVQVWDAALGHLPYGVVVEALVAAVRDVNYLTPAAIQERALQIYRERVRKATADVTPPQGLTPGQYLVWKRTFTEAVGEGADGPVAQRAALTAVGRSAIGVQAASRRYSAPPMTGLSNTPIPIGDSGGGPGMDFIEGTVVRTGTE